MAKHLVGGAFVAVATLADREITAAALFAFAAGDGERHNNSIAGLERMEGVGADVNDFAHELVAHDVAVLHSGHVAARLRSVQVLRDCGKIELIAGAEKCPPRATRKPIAASPVATLHIRDTTD
jgi:hypothetical protein